MEVVESSADGVTIMEPHGRMDTIGAKPFGDRVVALIHSGCKQIVIDLKHIQYISSAGFRALLVARKQSAETQGKLVLCGLSAELRRLFEIGAFSELFTICATRDEGLAKAK
jgi:anti-sigma B factor antagonist